MHAACLMPMQRQHVGGMSRVHAHACMHGHEHSICCMAHAVCMPVVATMIVPDILGTAFGSSRDRSSMLAEHFNG